MTVAMLDLAAQIEALGSPLREAMDAVMAHGRFVLGPEVDELEAALAITSGAATAVTCANGTDALVLALRALGVRPGDRVVVPAFTFAASAEAVVLVGALPVFADIREDTFNLDVSAMADALPAWSGPEPVGVIAVDLFGHPAEHPRLALMARDRGWWTITDAAQSFSATLDGAGVGHWGDLVTTSFFPSKPLGCFGDGGAILGRTVEHDIVLRSLRNHGAGEDRYDHVRIGMNSRLDTLQAAVLLQKLTRLDEERQARERLAQRYTSAFTGGPVVPPTVLPGVVSAWAQYTVRTSDRGAITAALDAADVQWAVYYPRTLADQPAFASSEELGPLPEARRASREVLSLPIHPYLSEAEQDRVIEAVLSVAVRA